MTPERIIGEVCIRKNCKERCPLTKPATFRLKAQIMIKILIVLFAGMLIGGGLAIRLHGQGLNRLSANNSDMIIMTTKVGIMDTTLQELVRKVDHLQSEADTTEAMGAGIGLAITFLQLLGFFARSKTP